MNNPAEQLQALTIQMIDFDAGDPKRIQHFIKVHSFARLIAEQERMDGSALFTLEAAALVHDIGIKPAMEKYDGRCNGHLQEIEGPAPAREMLTRLNFAPEVIDRVCYLVAHHHTYHPVDGLDYRILLEADFLVNLYEDQAAKDTIQTALETIFRTDSGRAICESMFLTQK